MAFGSRQGSPTPRWHLESSGLTATKPIRTSWVVKLLKWCPQPCRFHALPPCWKLHVAEKGTSGLPWDDRGEIARIAVALEAGTAPYLLSMPARSCQHPISQPISQQESSLVSRLELGTVRYSAVLQVKSGHVKVRLPMPAG